MGNVWVRLTAIILFNKDCHILLGEGKQMTLALSFTFMAQSLPFLLAPYPPKMWETTWSTGGEHGFCHWLAVAPPF